jgi:hypothetical protein
MPGTDAWSRARRLRDTANEFSQRAAKAPDAEVRSHYQQIAQGYASLAEAEENLVLRAQRSGLPLRR